MNGKMTRSFPASLEKLYDMLLFVKEQAMAAGFNDTHVSKIELAAEEALVNIISYGYPNSKGDIDISCNLPERKGIRIIIKDQGIPYNPLIDAKKFDPLLSKNGKSVGGYGVHFILKIMDKVDYTRENNSNVLTLVKYAD